MCQRLVKRHKYVFLTPLPVSERLKVRLKKDDMLFRCEGNISELHLRHFKSITIEYIENILRKLRQKLGFFFGNRSCFNVNASKGFVSATFLHLLDYSDTKYMDGLRSLPSPVGNPINPCKDCLSLTYPCPP